MNTAQCNLSTDAVNKQESSHIDTKLTVEQYNQLISLLSKQGNTSVESKEVICSNAMQVASYMIQFINMKFNVKNKHPDANHIQKQSNIDPKHKP